MATYTLFVVAEQLDELLRSEEVLNLSTAYSGIKWMETELRRVHKLLEEDPGLEMNHKDLRKWVRDLTDAAQNIEDIVDNFIFDLERRRQRMGWMSRPIRTLKGLVTRRKVASEIKQMKEKMGQICESMPKKQFIGFDKDFDALVKLLVEGNGPHPLYTFIVGPSGAGKTTLVKKVYDSDAVKEQFPFRFWVCDRERKFWFSSFLKKMPKKVTPGSNLPENYIFNALKGKRYLIVLDINLRYPGDINPIDDIISEFISSIRKALPYEMNGSRVVVTCNDKKDADRFGQETQQEIEVHELGMLSSEEKCKLFSYTWNFDAATAGMLGEIVRKQMHLPSEIVNLGDLLSKENRKSSALSNINMLDHPNYYQVDGPERTLLKIASSFSLLESPLKLFLLYCSLFPKGFEIPTRRVMRLWVAAGWFNREDESFYLGTGRLRSTVYFVTLSNLGMIQVEYSYFRGGYYWEGRDFEPEVKRIRLESPVWDLAALKAMQYNLSDSEGPPDGHSSSNTRGLALHSSAIYNHIFLDKKKDSLPNLRSLLCFPQLTVIGEVR